MPTLAANVTLVNPTDGLDYTFLAGDSAVPVWAQQMIFNPNAWVGGVAPYTPPTDLSGLQADLKLSCRVATTADIALTGLQIIDGVQTVDGDRVLVKSQATPSRNGIYQARAGVWNRAADADANAEVTSGFATFVTEGTVNGHIGFVLVTPDPIVVGTTALTFTAGWGTVAGALPGGPYAALLENVRSVSANVTDAAHNDVILMDASGAARAVTLPASTAGRRVRVKKQDSSVNAVTVTPTSGTIDGAASVAIIAQYQSETFIADGTNWTRQ